MRMLALALMATGLISMARAATTWGHDLPAALEQAQAEGRYVLVAFLGLDWSVSSKQWWRDIAESPQFQAFAEQRLVLVLADGTARKRDEDRKVDTALTEAHWALVKQLDIKSYPTIVLLAPDGAVMLRHGSTATDAAAYVQALSTLLVPLPTP